MGKKQKIYPQKGGYMLQSLSGGIIIPDKEQANAHFFELFNNPNALKSISLISDSSGYSLVVEIIFNAGFSRFLDNCGQRVDTFAIKIGFIKEGTRVKIIDTVENGIPPKYSITREEFEKEAEILRNVWETSQRNGYKMICPIYTCHKIDGNDFFHNLIQQMITYLSDHGYFLKRWADQGNEIGIIVMEKITNSESLDLLYKNQSRDEIILSKKVQSLVSIWASVIFLALKNSIINTDLHLNNFLINKTTGKIIMIDFGSCWLFKKIHDIREKSEQLIPGGHKYPKQIKVEDVLPIILDISHTDSMINENKKERGAPAFFGSTPLMERRDEVYAIIGWEQSREHKIFHAILTEYNSLVAPPQEKNECLIEAPKENEVVGPFLGENEVVDPFLGENEVVDPFLEANEVVGPPPLPHAILGKRKIGPDIGGSKRKRRDTRRKRRRKTRRRATRRRTRRHRR